MTYMESKFTATFVVPVDFFHIKAGKSDALSCYTNLVFLSEIRIASLVPKDFHVFIHIKRLHLLIFLNVPDQHTIFPIRLLDYKSNYILMTSIPNLFDIRLSFSSINIESDLFTLYFILTIYFHFVKIETPNRVMIPEKCIPIVNGVTIDSNPKQFLCLIAIVRNCNFLRRCNQNLLGILSI